MKTEVTTRIIEQARKMRREGKTYKEVAESLGISHASVAKYTKGISSKRSRTL